MSKDAMKLALEAVYETIIQWDEGGGKRSRRELARRIVALAEQPAQRRHISYVCPQCYWSLDEQPAQQEHITDGSRCWCNPELDYKDPDTGVEVWIHKEPQ